MERWFVEQPDVIWAHHETNLSEELLINMFEIGKLPAS